MTGKSATLESIVLDHMFMKAPLESPCEWWLELLTSTQSGFVAAGDNEIAALDVLGSRTLISSWTKVEPVITSGEVQHAFVYNSQEIILPRPVTGSWQVSHIAIWSAVTGGYLMYWTSLESFITISLNQPKSFRPGDLIIREF